MLGEHFFRNGEGLGTHSRQLAVPDKCDPKERFDTISRVDSVLFQVPIWSAAPG